MTNMVCLTRDEYNLMTGLLLDTHELFVATASFYELTDDEEDIRNRLKETTEMIAEIDKRIRSE